MQCYNKLSSVCLAFSIPSHNDLAKEPYFFFLWAANISFGQILFSVQSVCLPFIALPLFPLTSGPPASVWGSQAVRTAHAQRCCWVFRLLLVVLVFELPFKHSICFILFCMPTASGYCCRWPNCSKPGLRNWYGNISLN